MCIAYRSKANTDEVMCMKYGTKENHSRRGSYLLNVTYYKLRAEKHFAYYVISQGVEGYRVGGTHAPQGTLRPDNHEEEAKDYGQNGLVQLPMPW